MEEFLSAQGKWTVWITITFPDEVKVEYAKRKFKKFLKHLNEDYWFYDKFIHSFVFFELNPFRDGVHIHAIVDTISPEHAWRIHKKCNRLFGKSEVKPMHSDVIRYVSEMFELGTLESFDFYKINSRYRMKSKINQEVQK